MSWLFSQALVEAYSVATSQTSEPSAQLNVMPSPHLFWRNDKPMDTSRFSRFGLTLQLLTPDHGEALLEWFREGFRAKILAQPGGGAGITGKKSSAWNFMLDGIRVIGPEWVWVENSPVLTSRGLDVVLGDLAALGYDAEWDVFGAHHLGAPHQRDRIWILAHSTGIQGGLSSFTRETGADTERRCEDVADTLRHGLQGCRKDRGAEGPAGLCCGTGRNKKQNILHPAEQGLQDWRASSLYGPESLKEFERSNWWAAEPELGRVANGVAHRVDRLKAIGNGQVPAVAAFAYRTLKARF